MLRKTSPKRQQFFYTLLVLSILAGLFGAPAISTTKIALADPNDQPPIQMPEANYSLHLPIIASVSAAKKFFGVEFEHWYYNNNTIIQKASDAGVAWMRVSAFPWRDIEPTRYNPPVYNWSVIDEAALAKYAAKGFKVIATVRFTPSWAQMYPPNTYCGPVAQDYLDEFAQFMQNLVARYSVPPYNILYWEIGNEPDVDPALIPNDLDGPIGCWGDDADLNWYGGKYYATMLKSVYPAIKAANPNAKVVIGGLLMDCDPTHPPPGKTCLPTKFFEGILRGGGGPYFDVVSFHGYAFYWSGLIGEENNPNWAARGGLVLGKVNYLKEVMANNFVSKPIFHTEGALICHPNNTTECAPPVADFYEKQADYVVWVFVRTWAAGVTNSIWYPMMNGWYYTGLLDMSMNAKPAYNAYKTITQELHGAEYIREISLDPMLRTFEFLAPGRFIWVTWSPNYVPIPVNLPTGVLKVLDKYGNVVIPVNGQITVSSPVYIEKLP